VNGTRRSAKEDELAAYKGAKGSVQFPLEKPIPFDLIGRIVEYRVEKNREKAEAKRNPGFRA